MVPERGIGRKIAFSGRNYKGPDQLSPSSHPSQQAFASVLTRPI